MKVIPITDWHEIEWLTKATFAKDATIRGKCQTCWGFSFPTIAYVQKYKEWDCTHCGAKNSADGPILPEPTQLFRFGFAYVAILYKN